MSKDERGFKLVAANEGEDTKGINSRILLSTSHLPESSQSFQREDMSIQQVMTSRYPIEGRKFDMQS